MNIELDPAISLAPAAAWDAGAPVINGPAIYGASPGKAFRYLIPTVGERPMYFAAEGLPAGLCLDSASGIITGKAVAAGTYAVRLRAGNRLGTEEKAFTIVIADHALALTPPMGWNSWNCFRGDIDAEKIARIADGMVSSGLAARGYAYVNLDSGWQSGTRGGPFNAILPHDGFPDMGTLCARIHALGLKMGIYSGPYVIPWGTEGCGTTSGLIDTNFNFYPQYRGKYIGMTKHEAEDVAQWAEWGIDYFKYDWGHTDMELTERMSRALRHSSRDIVFSITTGVDIADVRTAARLCNLWRSNADTSPTWESVVHNGFANEQWNPVIGPGHWFDLDMTAIQPRNGSRLSEHELIVCVSCWAMRPSPLLIDCNPNAMDAFTRDLLCNEEVIAVNQDPLGKPAVAVVKNDGWEVQLKPLADGSCALGFFNLSETSGTSPEIEFAHFGLGSEVSIRDLWAKQDLDGRRAKLAVAVDRHCARLFRVMPCG